MLHSRQGIDRKFAERARLAKAAEPLTPAHSAAAAANEFADDNAEAAEAERRRRRIQHEVDPYLPVAEGVAEADLDKRFNQAYDPTEAGYPQPAVIHPEQFRRGPVTTGEAAYSSGYEPPFPVSSLAPDSTLVARPLLQDGQPEVGMSAIRWPC